MRNTLLILLAALAFTASAQQDAPCRDIIWLKSGDRFQGKIISYQPDGDIHFQTWNGTDIRMPSQNIRKITQNCGQSRPYAFKEKGWYHATRGSITLGRDFYGYNTGGVSLLHSSGYSLERRLGVGLGIGVENYAMSEEGPASYPVFAEVRGYVRAKRVSPFYVAGGGWSFAGRNESSRWNQEENWDGGWMALTQIGIRFGNHFTVHTGLRFQRMNRNWTSFWDNGRGTDRILYQRMELGIGLLL